MQPPDERREVIEASPDPPERGPRFRLVNIRPGPAQRYVCLSERCWAIWTHWQPLTRPCYGSWDRCEGCKHYLGKRWSAYLSGFETVTQERVIVPVTEWAAKSAKLADLRARGISLRGVGLCLRRVGIARNSMVRLELLKLREPLSELPPAGPILPTLLALWGIEDYAPPVIQLWEEDNDDGEPEAASPRA